MESDPALLNWKAGTTLDPEERGRLTQHHGGDFARRRDGRRPRARSHARRTRSAGPQVEARRALAGGVRAVVPDRAERFLADAEACGHQFHQRSGMRLLNAYWGLLACSSLASSTPAETRWPIAVPRLTVDARPLQARCLPSIFVGPSPRQWWRQLLNSGIDRAGGREAFRLPSWHCQVERCPRLSRWRGHQRVLRLVSAMRLRLHMERLGHRPVQRAPARRTPGPRPDARPAARRGDQAGQARSLGRERCALRPIRGRGW